MENVGIMGLMGEPRIMQAVAALWESLGPFIFCSSEFSNICVLIFRLIDFVRGKRRNQLSKYYSVIAQCVDLVYIWAKMQPSKLKHIVLSYKWTRSTKVEEYTTEEKRNIANGNDQIFETTAALKVLEKCFEDFPKLTVLIETITTERKGDNVPFEMNSETQSLFFYKGTSLEILNGGLEATPPISCDIDSDDKLRLENMLRDNDTMLATLTEISHICAKIPSLLSQIYEDLHKIAFRALPSSFQGGETEAIACKLRALELLLMYLYICTNESHISTVFDEYVSLLSSSKILLEVKKQALKSSMDFANFAIARKDFQKLLRISFGLSSACASGEIYQQLTTCLRGEFNDL